MRSTVVGHAAAARSRGYARGPRAFLLLAGKRGTARERYLSCYHPGPVAHTNDRNVEQLSVVGRERSVPVYSMTVRRIQMTDTSPIELFHKEFLADHTRRERQALLVTSASGIAVVLTGLLPTKISALGIDFTISNQTAMLWIVSALVAYFLTAFCIHGSSDYMSWKTSFQRRVLEAKRHDILNEKSDEEHLRTLDIERNKRLLRAHASTPLPKRRRQAVLLRNAFDFGFPVLLAVLAIAMLLTATPPPAPQP